jgi:HK97 family phage prohead protease
MRTKTRQTRTHEATFETRETGEEKRIEGYFSVFGSDYNIAPGASESIDPHAFDDALAQDDVRVLVDHDTRLVLGRTSAGTAELRVDDHGLWGSVLINPDDTDALNAYARNKRGDVTQASFGFDILDEETEKRADGSIHWTIKKVKLYEVSLCTFPAYQETELQARREDLQEIRRRETEAIKINLLDRLRAAGKGKGNKQNA